MYAANKYFWRRYRINYSFIFGFKQGTELGYREVLLLGFGLVVLSLASVLANLDMEIDPKTNDCQALTELVPLSLVVVRLLKLFKILPSKYFPYQISKYICSKQFLFSLVFSACSYHHIPLPNQHFIPIKSLLPYPMFVSLHLRSYVQGEKCSQAYTRIKYINGINLLTCDICFSITGQFSRFLLNRSVNQVCI